MKSFNPEKIINTIKRGEIVDEKDVVDVITKLMELLVKERNVLILQSPITICGDIHGQLDDLLQLFETSGPIKNQNYLFMGDYVDRGYFSLNTFLLLACYKVTNNQYFHLLRGNHESRQVSQVYGFYNECISYYGHSSLWLLCNDAFDMLPVAAVIDNRIFSVHGGLSPDAPFIDCISTLDRQDEIPQNGLFCDLVWSDPENVKQFRHNPRGAGFMFGPNEVNTFCQLNRIKLITRSHQLADDGYEFFFIDENDKKKQKKIDENETKIILSEKDLPAQIVTVWSAPDYSYRSGNKASIMKYANQTYQIMIFDKNPNRIKPKYDRPNGSIYFT